MGSGNTLFSCRGVRFRISALRENRVWSIETKGTKAKSLSSIYAKSLSSLNEHDWILSGMNIGKLRVNKVEKYGYFEVSIKLIKKNYILLLLLYVVATKMVGQV